jgi:hypothetical protein
LNWSRNLLDKHLVFVTHTYIMLEITLGFLNYFISLPVLKIIIKLKIKGLSRRDVVFCNSREGTGFTLPSIAKNSTYIVFSLKLHII